MGRALRTTLAPMLACGVLGSIQANADYAGDAATTGVTVSGRVILVGTVPKRAKTLPVTRDPDFCGTTMPNESLLLDGTSRAVFGVVVSLDGIAKGKPLPVDQTLVVDNRACRFHPRISAIGTGSVLEIRNSDPIMHNTRIHKDSRFGPDFKNVVQPAGAKAIQKPLHEPGMLDIRCNAHPFMYAAVHVFEHPYSAVTDAAGRFELTQVPPGKYRVKMWHEFLGERETTLTVPAKGPVAVDLELRQED